MKITSIQSLGDKTAIGLSFLCIAHCLLLPLIILILPWLASYWISSENFHLWLLVGVVFNSVYALTLGYLKHAQKSILLLVVIGLIILLFAFLSGSSLLGEFGEKLLTVIGAVVVAVGHAKNFLACDTDNSDC